MLSITPIPAFQDNYIWCFYCDDSKQAVIVDPGSSQEVVDFLAAKSLQLKAIMLTHHHPDHTGGIAELKSRFDVPVVGYTESRYQPVDLALQAEQSIELLGTRFELITVPGHTLDHVAFYSAADHTHEQPWLFCGDTLFSCGCGRLFEGSPQQMYDSLQDLNALPGNTQVFCAHEYTLANIRFAQSLMPSNPALQDYADECMKLRKQGKPTIPSRLDTERQVNPFLRATDAEISEQLGLSFNSQEDPVSAFAAIRKAKDTF